MYGSPGSDTARSRFSTSGQVMAIESATKRTAVSVRRIGLMRLIGRMGHIGQKGVIGPVLSCDGTPCEAKTKPCHPERESRDLGGREARSLMFGRPARPDPSTHARDDELSHDLQVA